MNKATLFGTVAACALAGSAGAQTLSYVKSIDVGATAGGGAAPVGLAFYNGSVFVNTFNDKKIVKVANPLDATPTVSTLADLSSEFTWAAGRGISGIDINPANGNIYVAGDTGTNGALAVYSQAGTQINKATLTDRIAAGTLWGPDPDFLVTRVLSSAMAKYSDPAVSGTPTSEATGPTTVAPVNAAHRDVIAIGNDIYYTRNAASTLNAVAKLTGGTAGAFTNYDTGSAVYQSTGTAQIAFEGIAPYTYAAGSKTYVIYADSAAGKVVFIDTADNSVDVTLQSPTLTTGIRDVVVGQINGSDYLFVSRSSGTPANAIDVFAIDAAAGVDEWSLY